MGTLGQIWKARKEIKEGVFNTLKKDKFVEMTAEYRMNICKKCSFYDGDCTVAGTGPCCGACGCSLKFKTRSLSTVCGAVQLGEDPKWLPVLSQAEEDELNVKELDELNERNNTGDN